MKKLAQEAGVSEDVARLWLIYLPVPKNITKFDVTYPDSVHQADFRFLRLPRGRKVYEYALTVVDVASKIRR